MPDPADPATIADPAYPADPMDGAVRADSVDIADPAGPAEATRATKATKATNKWARQKPPGAAAFLPWLLMLSGDVADLVHGRMRLPWLAGAGVLAFIGCYTTAVCLGLDERRRGSRACLWSLAGLAAVSYALALGYGHYWLECFPLLSLATGIVLRGQGPGQGLARGLGRRLGPTLLVLAASVGAMATVDGGGGEGALTVAYGTMLSGLVTAAILSLFDTVAMLRATRQDLARTAVEKERLRFSRDLHDLLGHTMSVVVVKAEAVRRLAPRDVAAALGQAADIEAVGRQALTEIREAVTGYREGGLATELHRARSLLDASGIEPVVQQSGPPLPPQTEALLGWVVREGVTNVVRHSRAARCEVVVRCGAERVYLEITDDGCGTPSDPPATGAGSGTGLRGLAERLSAAGGSLDFGPDRRRGFRLSAELPADTDIADPATGPLP
jgi:two-component system, NarL family, sensor histidine kinase DesK